MQRDQPGPVRPGLKQGLVPDFRLRSRIGEDQAAGAGIQLRGDLRQHFQADMSGPWKAFDPGRQQRVHLQFLGRAALNADAAALWDQYLFGVGLITQGRGYAPHDQLRMPAAQTGEGQLQLHAAFVAKQFVPFVDHHHAQGRERCLGVGSGEHQGQAFRGGNQRGWQASALARPFAAAGIARAQADTPGNLRILQRRLQCAGRVGGQGAHGGYPQYGQGSGHRFAFARCFKRRRRVGEAIERAKPDRVGFAGAGAGVQQTGLSLFYCGPYLFLKVERLPVARGKPAFCEVGGGSHAGGVRSESVPSVTTAQRERFND
ncbi:hypothetical protein D3C76_852500 [compost metagenome]